VEDIYAYNEEIDAFIEKATGKIAALERATWIKKLLMVTVAAALFVLIVLLLILRCFV
jgi:nitrate/nitrite-specific signal transduction histidine kinase